MMYNEFVERTGYEPSMQEYAIIEEAYYCYTGNKDEFCEAWKQYHDTALWQSFMKTAKTLSEQEYENRQLEKQIAGMEHRIKEQDGEIEDRNGQIMYMREQIDCMKAKMEAHGLLEKFEYVDRQDGELLTHKQAVRKAIEQYDYMDDTNCITFEELFEKVQG